jgi:hypothetical protein
VSTHTHEIQREGGREREREKEEGGRGWRGESERAGGEG